MKKQSFVLLTSISKKELENLTVTVKETLAFGRSEKEFQKPFTSTDLWNIQRQAKGRIQRKYL